MKTIYLLPGFRYTLASKGFPQLISIVKTAGYQHIPYTIKWNYSVLTNNINDFTTFYNKKASSTEENTILGFSFGALIALASFPQLNQKPQRLILCSLSPYFKEDIKNLEKVDIESIGTKRYKDISNISVQELCPQITCKVDLLYGSVEAKKYPDLESRILETHQAIKNSSTEIIADVDHDISDARYLNTIAKLL